MSSLFKSKNGSKRKRPAAESSEPAVLRIPEAEEAPSRLQKTTTTTESSLLMTPTFNSLGLSKAITSTLRALGLKTPTPIQRHAIPQILKGGHLLAISPTGSGKTAAFILPILQTLFTDPYGIYAVILSPTRELALQIHEQVLALGGFMGVTSALVVGGGDFVKQTLEVSKMPHFVVGTPGRLGTIVRNDEASNMRNVRLQNVRFVVLDEADRLLSKSGFEKDVGSILNVTCKSRRCQTVLFSATMTASLEEVGRMAGGGGRRLPLVKIRVKGDDTVVEGEESEDEDDDENDSDGDGEGEGSKRTTRIPAGLSQKYVFMPSHMRDVYLVTAIRCLITNAGLKIEQDEDSFKGSGWTTAVRKQNDGEEAGVLAQSCCIFVDKCERAAYMEGTLRELGIDCVALHSLLSQDRRMAALGKFKSQQVRILVATDVASRGLDIPEVDLVINAELPRRAEDYIHRCGRTARAGRRGLAVSLVGEHDVELVHACEELAGRSMGKCEEVKDKDAVKIVSSVSKAQRLTKVKMMELGFDELVQKRKDRKAADNRERQKIDKKMKRGK